MKPFWMRRHFACPDCGYVYSDYDLCRMLAGELTFDCPRCKAHYTEEDFMEENRENGVIK